MLSQLLSSKPKSNLINLFLAHPQRSFSLTELRISSKCPNPMLKQTVRELNKIDFLLVWEKHKQRYWQINKHFALYPEFVNMLRKIKRPPEDSLAKNALKLKDCKLVVLTGIFVGHPRLETDLLFVGKVSPKRLAKFIRLAEKFAQQEVGYTVFSPQEFEYRKIMNDRFVKNILENDPLIVIDKTRNRNLWNRPLRSTINF